MQKLSVPKSIHIPYKSRSLWTLKSSETSPVSDTRIKSEKKFGLKEDHAIICRECGNPITSAAYVLTVNNHHKHTFINPAGITYQIGCFSAAEGCIVYGTPSTDHTWFTGFAWNYAICSNCQVHLGWYFQNGDESFFGLILDLLADAGMNH